MSDKGDEPRRTSRRQELGSGALEALYREAAKDELAEAEALAWVEALPDDALTPESAEDILAR